MSSYVADVRAAIGYIEEHLTEKMSLDTVANAAHYSKYHLHRIFTETVGMTIHDYIKRRKLTEAAKLLIFSKKPIMEIAFISGYESQQAFTSSFKAMYKQTPNQFREKEEFYPLQLRFTLKDSVNLNSGALDLEQTITFASQSDVLMWMDLVRLSIDGFPCLRENDYLDVLKQCINDRRALIMKDNGIAIGILLFSYDTGSIDFLGIHPQYRNKGVAKAFLDKVMDEFLKDREISITTFREGDKADTGYRRAFKKLGFAEAELLTEFGYPTQKLILSPQKLQRE